MQLNQVLRSAVFFQKNAPRNVAAADECNKAKQLVTTQIYASNLTQNEFVAREHFKLFTILSTENFPIQSSH